MSDLLDRLCPYGVEVERMKPLVISRMAFSETVDCNLRQEIFELITSKGLHPVEVFNDDMVIRFAWHNPPIECPTDEETRILLETNKIWQERFSPWRK